MLTDQSNTLSLDSASVFIPNATRTSSHRIDLPMRAFAGGFYNNLRSMYDHLGIQYQSQPFLFEFAHSKSPYFTHASNLHRLPARQIGASLVSYLFDLAYLVACYIWFSVCCFIVIPQQGETLQAYLERTWIPQHFITFYVLPLISSMATCPHDSLLAFPASDLTAYKQRTHRAPHYTISKGVRAAQDRLSKDIQYELNAAITVVDPQEKGVRLSWKNHDDQLQMETFDYVVLAVALDIVGQVFEPLQYYMERVPTTVVESVVHTDKSVLNLGQQSPVKMSSNTQLIHLNTSTDDQYKTESHHIQPCGAIVSTCPFSLIDEACVTHSAKFTRVLRSPQSQRIVDAVFGDAQEIHSDKDSVPLWRNGDDGVLLVGGWCWDGMVLLEGCVVSAMRVADALDINVPWR